MNAITKSALWVSFCLILASPASAQTYTITDLGVLRGDTASASIGINSSGQIVGCSDTSTTYWPCSGTQPGHAFLWNSKTGMKDLGTLHGDETSGGIGINDPGEVVGYSQNAQGVYRAFLWTKKTGMIALRKLPGGTTNFAAAINAAGLIVGESDFKNSNGIEDAVLWTADRKIHDLGTLPGAQLSQGGGINSRNEVCGSSLFSSGGVVAWAWTKGHGMKALRGFIKGGATVAFAINDSGIIVGNADTSSGRHAVLWNNKGRIRDLGTFRGGGGGTAFGVNDLDQIVGYLTTSSNDRHAFIWSRKTGIQDLNDLIPANSGWVLVWGSAINNVGQITGWGTINGENHAYLLIP
jgi:probable HAF family extracellular repeat protein